MRNPVIHNRSTFAFTSVELLVAIVAAGVLILTAGTMLFYGYRAWDDHLFLATVGRDATHVLDRFARDVRAASGSDVSPETHAIHVTTPLGVATLAHEEEGVVYYPDEGGDITLIPIRSDTEITAFTLETNANSASLTIRLSARGENLEFSRTAAWRN